MCQLFVVWLGDGHESGCDILVAEACVAAEVPGLWADSPPFASLESSTAGAAIVFPWCTRHPSPELGDRGIRTFIHAAPPFRPSAIRCGAIERASQLHR
jgi:hypothetical protein